MNLYTKAFIKEIHESTPDWQQCRLGNLKHKSLHWMVLFVHDDHHHLLCIILEEDSTRMKSWETNRGFLNFSDSAPGNILPSQWEASHSEECPECTDSALGDMTSENSSGEGLGVERGNLFSCRCDKQLARAHTHTHTCTGTLYFFLFWNIPEG